MSVTALAPAPKATPASLRMSFEEFLDWLDEDTHAEWADGAIVMHSPVSRRHSDLNGFLSAVIRLFVGRSNGGEVHCDPFQMKTGAKLPSRAPDIIFVARENLSRLRTNLLEGPADLVVEIISPESRGRDRSDKFREYEQGGVREYWLLDPERRSAEFYWLGADGRYTVAALDADGRFHSAVLVGFWLGVDWLWQDPLPTPWDVIEAWGI